MALLFADEDFPWPVVHRLRRLGHDVLTTGDVGMASRGVPDHILLEYATLLDRAVLTFNSDDFLQLHDGGAPHAGIIACEADVNFDELAKRVDAAVAREPSLSGRFVEVRKA